MNLKEMTKKNLILLDVESENKEEIIHKLIEKLYEENIIKSKEDFLSAVMQREQHSPTGLERGIAIPHGKSDTVKKAAFAVARLKNKINTWESVTDDNEVDLVFLLAIPTAEAGSTHLKLLAELSSRLMYEEFTDNLHKAKNKEEFIKELDSKEEIKEENKEYTKTILAVTACAAGIAHTYMAAENLEKVGREMGVNVLVEKQGANGIEDRHTKEQIKNADGVIFACDIAAKEPERYAGLNYVKVKVAEPLKNSEKLIKKVLNNPDGVVTGDNSTSNEDKSEGKGIFSKMMEAVMTGISYMIPVIVAAGLMMGIAKLSAMGLGVIDNMGELGNSSNGLYVFLFNLDRFGNLIFKFIYPIFSAYVAFSIADRPGLIPGFMGGVFAAGLHYTFWNIDGGIPSGFIGALILGLVAGYVTKFLNDNIKLNKHLNAIKPMLLLPGIGVLVIFVLNFYVVDPVFGGLNLWMMNYIKSFTGAGTLVLTAIIAACTAFDLGGPVNKAAGAIAIGLAADAIFPLTGRVLAIVIPPIGLGLATVLDKYIVRRRVFDDNLRVVGGTSILLGFIAVSEGAIPFMLKNPLITIPINIIGAIIGSCTAVALGAVQWNPLPAIWGWPLVENLGAYLVGLTAGVAFIAVANILVRFYIIKRKEAK